MAANQSACAVPSGPVHPYLPQCRRDARHGQDEVHRTRNDGASGHAGIAGLVGVLRDDQAAVFLDRLQAQAAIRAGARQDHAGGERPAVGGQGVQQEIEGQSRTMTRQGLRDCSAPPATAR